MKRFLAIFRLEIKYVPKKRGTVKHQRISFYIDYFAVLLGRLTYLISIRPNVTVSYLKSVTNDFSNIFLEELIPPSSSSE